MAENTRCNPPGGFAIQRQYSPLFNEVPPFSEIGFFFNDAVHLAQQATGTYVLLTATDQATGIAEARCALFTDAQTGVITSPAAAPFGSVEFTESLPDHVLDQLLDAMVETARQANAPVLRIVNYPHCYAPKQAERLTHKLLELDFQVTESVMNQYILVTDHLFGDSIAPSERRRLAKCQRADFQFRQWCNPEVETVIGFIDETRRLHNYTLTIAPERLAHLLQSFPDQFNVFVVADGATIAALTITVRVRHDILYAFLPASHPDYRSFSPMVLLINGLYRFCQKEHIPLLDLGLSLGNNRQPKLSLMQFKERLGALSSVKLTFEKALLCSAEAPASAVEQPLS